MTTNEIRAKFLDFFKSKGHSIIASDSLVPKDDPTVLFTTAGMQQFKPQFLGRIDGFTRASTCQKCLRTDDLDVVGKTDFHHTFFEMLGNFSFGDYFKKEAIHWAWEFLTVELKLPKEKLWVSVYKDDEEAYQIWLNEIQLPTDRIVKLGDKSNFWPSNAKLNGPNGPCGPCSEIFYDYGVNPKCPNGAKCDPDCSCGRFSEVWNLVFTQFNRKEGGVLDPLPANNIDTGMGLERLVAVVQGKKSNYETDNFSAILKVIKDTFKSNNAQLTESEFRIIADHIRAVTVGISDGVVPSNEGRGYVMRKLIVDMTDLAIRGGFEKPVIHTFVDVVVDVMKTPYPDLVSKISDVKTSIKRIEEAFIKIRKEKIPELENKIREILKINNEEERIQKFGQLLFYYHDTHGLTLPTMQTIAKDVVAQVENLTITGSIKVSIVDTVIQNVYEPKMEEQKNRSRASSKMMGDVFADQNFALNVPKTEFLGYSEIKASAQILKIINDQGEVSQSNKGDTVKIILNRTPFYAESGGQVGDIGSLTSASGALKVLDTQKTNDIFIHTGVVEAGVVKIGDQVQAVIDNVRRLAIMRNHTATHLLQSALREVLGSHIKQQGSLVEEGRLRFDFTHPTGIQPQQMQNIENRLGEFISKADKVQTEVLPLEEAKKKGALAFFAEKYGQTVRIISIGDYSKEFCGGTHVSSTSEIEKMKIVSEGSVAQGIRRIEAITGKTAVGEFLKKKQEEEQAKQESQRMKLLEKEKLNSNFEQMKSSVDEIISSAQTIRGVSLVTRCFFGADIGMLKKLSDLLKQKTSSTVFVLGAKGQEDASLIVSVTDDLVAKGIKANEIIGRIAPLFGASGGGKPQLAQAGSREPQKIESAIAQAKDLILI